MKSWSLWNWGLVLVVTALLVAGGRAQEASSQATNTPPAIEPQADAEAAAQEMADDETALGEQTEQADLAKAEAKPISTEKPLPPNIKPSGPAAEVIRLAESGVDESVIMAFVTNSTSPFNLGVDEIIYLNDIGVSGTVVTAMMRRDEALKGLAASAGAVPAAPALIAPTNQFAPEPVPPAMYAPQPIAAAVPPEVPPEGPPPAEYAPEAYPLPPATDTGYSTYYDSLAPYGTWVDVAGYGPCWQPTVVVVNPTWRPYCDSGRWVYTDCGWYWLSGYSWGWAPFHYGRWFQHQRLGWCWAPDTVWGPSWVCWRYTGSHCGWAPLPPGAWYRPGYGLTYHGRQVHGSFGFGLGVRSYAFVDVSHFQDPHLNRHALPPRQAAQVYRTTAAATTIVGNNHRVVNHGIPVGRVAAATRTEVPRVALREVNAPAGQGARGERFEGNSRTLSVSRPQFPPNTGAQPGPGGRSRSELRNGAGGPTAAPVAQRVTRDASPRVMGGTTIAQPTVTEHPATRAERPAPATKAAAPTATSPARTIRTVRNDPAPSSAAPLILHGTDRSDPATGRSGADSVNQAASARPPVVTGRREVIQQPPVNPPSAPTVATSRSRPTVSPQEAVPRSTPNQRPQPVISQAWPSRAPSGAAGSTPRPTAPLVRSEPQRPFTPPSFQAPAVMPRVAPAPAPTPLPRPSFSPPTLSSTPRPQPMVSRPAYSAPTPAPQPIRSFSPPTVSPSPRPQPMESRPAYSAPAPAPAPRPSFSPPIAPSAPRAPAMESRPAFSAPSAPASSAPAVSAPSGRGSPSSNRGGR